MGVVISARVAAEPCAGSMRQRIRKIAFGLARSLYYRWSESGAAAGDRGRLGFGMIDGTVGRAVAWGSRAAITVRQEALGSQSIVSTAFRLAGGTGMGTQNRGRFPGQKRASKV